MYIPTSSSSFTRLPAREQKAVCRKWNGRSISHPAGLGGRNSFVCSTEGARNDRLSRSSNIGRPIELIEPKRVKKKTKQKSWWNLNTFFWCDRKVTHAGRATSLGKLCAGRITCFFLTRSLHLFLFFANTTKSLSFLTLSKAWKWLIPSHAIILVRRWSEWDPIWILSLSWLWISCVIDPTISLLLLLPAILSLGYYNADITPTDNVCPVYGSIYVSLARRNEGRDYVVFCYDDWKRFSG